MLNSQLEPHSAVIPELPRYIATLGFLCLCASRAGSGSSRADLQSRLEPAVAQHAVQGRGLDDSGLAAAAVHVRAAGSRCSRADARHLRFFVSLCVLETMAKDPWRRGNLHRSSG